jgi:hypothetical protein
VILRGGYTNDGKVVRIDDTVRRPWRATSPATAALLRHLEATGFEGAPHFLGRDDEGREVLSYVRGEAAIEPHPPWALTDDALVSVARVLRRFHDAVASFDPTPYDWPHAVPERVRAGTISHNDPNLDNVVFVAGEAVALTDFDLASPGSAVWDVACGPAVGATARPGRRPARPPARAPAPVRRRLRVTGRRSGKG